MTSTIIRAVLAGMVGQWNLSFPCNKSLRNEGRIGSIRGQLEILAIAWILFFLFSLNTLGQTRSAEPVAPAHPPDYSKESFVIQKMRTDVSFEDDGTGVRTYSVQVRVQSQAGVQQWGLLRLGYSSDFEQPQIEYVRVHKSDGSVVETPAADIQDVTSDVSRIARMYTDYHEKHVAVKGLGVLATFSIIGLLYPPAHHSCLASFGSHTISTRRTSC